MRYEDKEINSVGELVEFLKSDVSTGQPVWFRGQANSGWQLKPSLARQENLLRAEKMLIKRFIQTASPYLIDNIPKTDWDWIFLMQHYRVPTRLLDWTENSLVALYFAVLDIQDSASEHDGALWCLDPLKLNKEARLKFGYDRELPAFGIDKVVDNYLPEKLEDDVTDTFPIAAIGQRNSARMIAQMGTFTINHVKHYPIEDIGEKMHVWRYVVPYKSRASIMRELEHLGYVELTLFPELECAARKVKKEFMDV